jgi:protein associated with RNAse G/E
MIDFDPLADSAPEITVRKLLYDGTPQYVWEGRLVESNGNELVVEAAYTRDSYDLGYVVFERGDVFYEFYYLDRWYNVFQIYSGRGELKGWYCNIARPATLVGPELRFVDLALDLFAYPDGSALPLDVEEFEAHAASDYAPADVRAARAAFDTLLALHREARLPGRPFTAR